MLLSRNSCRNVTFRNSVPLSVWSIRGGDGHVASIDWNVFVTWLPDFVRRGTAQAFLVKTSIQVRRYQNPSLLLVRLVRSTRSAWNKLAIPFYSVLRRGKCFWTSLCRVYASWPLKYRSTFHLPNFLSGTAYPQSYPVGRASCRLYGCCLVLERRNQSVLYFSGVTGFFLVFFFFFVPVAFAVVVLMAIFCTLGCCCGCCVCSFLFKYQCNSATYCRAFSWSSSSLFLSVLCNRTALRALATAPAGCCRHLYSLSNSSTKNKCFVCCMVSWKQSTGQYGT